MNINFIHDFKAKPNMLEQLSPLVRRLICHNPSPYTYTGTGTFIIGTGQVAVIDPGPINAQHLDNILKATEGEVISHILITHTHKDHSPLAIGLAKRTGAKIFGFKKPETTNDDDMGEKYFGDEEVDKTYNPDHILKDGDSVEGENWTIKAIHTPGHTSNHLCYELCEEKTLFSGDHIMAWSTSVVIPPDGNMADYMNSLERILAGNFKTIRPTHGPAIIEPHGFVEQLLAHRMEREKSVLLAIAEGQHTISEMVATIYPELPNELLLAASMSVMAHIHLLLKDGRLKCAGKPTLDTRFELG